MIFYVKDRKGNIIESIYVSKNGREYSILDMVDLHHRTTSGMVAIMDYNLDQRAKDVGNEIVTYFATDYSESDIKSACESDVEKYETEHGIAPQKVEPLSPLDDFTYDAYNNKIYVGDTVRLLNGREMEVVSIGRLAGEVTLKDDILNFEPIGQLVYTEEQMRRETRLVERA